MSAVNEARGSFVWYDLMVPDPDKAIAFYGEVVGWKTQAWAGAQTTDVPPYKMWMASEQAPIGGVMELPKEAADMGAPPHWLAYTCTADTDAVVAKTKELGGKVLREPWDIEGVGRIAILQDPQGAVFAPYTPSGEPPKTANEPKYFTWSELYTSDTNAGWKFYAELFDLKTTDSMEISEGQTYQMFTTHNGSRSLGGLMSLPEGMPQPAWLHYVTVDDLDGALERIKNLGGQILNGPMEVPGGDRIAQCVDNQGAAFAVHAAPKN